MGMWRRLTVRGRVFLLGGAALSLLAAGFAQRELLGITLFFVLAPLVALLLGLRTGAALTCARDVTPARTPRGTPTTGRLTVSMNSRFVPSLFRFEDVVPPELGARPRFDSHRVFGRWRRTVTYPLPASRRGVFQTGPLLVRRTDALGLTRVDTAFSATSEVLVTPRIEQLRPSALGLGSGRTGEQTPLAIGTTGQDDVLVREHRQGDDLRRVHWRTTARHGELMVRREEQSFDPGVTILFDTRSKAWVGDEEFEWAVSAVTSAAVDFVRRGFTVTIVDADAVPIRPSHADPVLNEEDIVLAMTRLQRNPVSSLGDAVSQISGEQASQTLVVVLGIVGIADAVLLVSTLRAGTRPRVLVAGGLAEDAAAVLDEKRWIVHRATPRESVREAFESLGDLR